MFSSRKAGSRYKYFNFFKLRLGHGCRSRTKSQIYLYLTRTFIRNRHRGVSLVGFTVEQRIPRVRERFHRADPAHLSQGEGSFQGDSQFLKTDCYDNLLITTTAVSLCLLFLSYFFSWFSSSWNMAVSPLVRLCRRSESVIKT
jgi:hypothetical protein